MKRITYMVELGAGLVAAMLLSALAFAPVALYGQNATVAGNPEPTNQQIHALFARVVENQHRNDRAMEEFERIEHVVSRKSTDTSDGFTDRTDRIIPFGAGTLKLEMSENGSRVSPELYRHELQIAVTALNSSAHPTDRYRQDVAKFEKRRRERAELVDMGLKAFRATWMGRETRGSRTLDKFDLDPNPDFRPTNRLAATFEHVHAVIWIDASQAQIARIEGDITSDITFVGGIAGKVNHGGHFVMENSEVEPGVWLPTLYTYDVDGRKFVFGFGVHERTDVTGYHRVGPPLQAIEIVRSDLNNLSAQTPSR